MMTIIWIGLILLALITGFILGLILALKNIPYDLEEGFY